jgi:hypothetical protein
MLQDGRIFGSDGLEYTESDQVLSFNTRQPVKIVLTIAHLDHDKHNHDIQDDRLAALCQACHLNYDRPRHVSSRKANKDKSKSIGLFNNPSNDH